MPKIKTLRRVEIIFSAGNMNPDIHVEWDVQDALADGTPDPEDQPRTRRGTVKVSDLDTPVNIPGLGNKKLRALIDAHHAEATAAVVPLQAALTAEKAKTETLEQQAQSLRAELEEARKKPD